MDWLDQYLQGLNAPGAMMHFPPDKPSWNAPAPSKQQMALMQDATIADMVRMRNIQEARQMEIDAGAGGSYDAGSAAREKRPVTPAVPSGIPVASTASVAVAGFAGGNSECNGTYIKQSTGYSFSSDYANEITITGISYIFVASSAAKLILLPPESSIFVDAGYPTTISASGTWRIGNITTSNEGEYVSYGLDYDTNNPASNASSNNNYIPTTGWSPAITITPGISVASTASVNIAQYSFFNPFPKRVSGYGFVGFGGEYSVSINSGIAYISTSGNGDAVLAAPNTIFYIGGSPFYTASAWQLLFFNEGPTVDVTSLNSSTDPTTIPTTGWSPSRTITVT
jgi:hypothetical protein